MLRRFATFVAIAASALLFADALPTDLAAASSERPFAPTSPWNVRIPVTPRLDPRSDAIVSHLSSGEHPAVANVEAYGVPIWHADESTPRYQVECTNSWGTCQLALEPVPIPDGARPSSGTDGAMVVVDEAAGKAYEFWRATQADGTWRTAWGDVVDLAGHGTPGETVGAGVSRLAGVVRTEEVARGHIDHALVFSTDNACAGEFRYPASKTDGTSTRSDCIPQGARIQLDPAIDVDALPNLTPIERMLARALQVHGAYAVDNGGARMAFVFEVPQDGGERYRDAGLEWDFFALDRIPWSSLRVLDTWNGGVPVDPCLR